jgi:hypothetical protein
MTTTLHNMVAARILFRSVAIMERTNVKVGKLSEEPSISLGIQALLC